MTLDLEKYNDMGVPLSSLTGGGEAFKPLDAKEYDFVVTGIVGLGLRPHTYKREKLGDPNAVVPVIRIYFELPSEIRKDGKTEVISYKYNNTKGPLGTHYKICKMLLGERVTDETIIDLMSAKGLKELIGKTGVLTIKHWKKDGDKVVACIDKDGFFKLDPRLPQPAPVRKPFFLNPFYPDIEVFKSLSFVHQKEIMEALNACNFPVELHKAWVEVQEEKNIKDNQKQVSQNSVTAASKPAATEVKKEPNIVDDDIPPFDVSTDAIE